METFKEGQNRPPKIGTNSEMHMLGLMGDTPSGLGVLQKVQRTQCFEVSRSADTTKKKKSGGGGRIKKYKINP